MTSTAFEIGDRVKWTSQAAGTSKTKEGRVVEIVPPGVIPTVRAPGLHRTHVSYVIEVTRPKSVKRYWPRVAALALVSKPS